MGLTTTAPRLVRLATCRETAPMCPMRLPRPPTFLLALERMAGLAALQQGQHSRVRAKGYWSRGCWGVRHPPPCAPMQETRFQIGWQLLP